MKQKCNVSTVLTLVVLLMASHLGLAQSRQSPPTAQAQETSVENNQRLNDVTDATLASSFSSSSTAEIGGSKMEKGRTIEPTSPLLLRPVICPPYMHNSETGLWYSLLTMLASRTVQRAIDRSGTTDLFQLNRLLPLKLEVMSRLSGHHLPNTAITEGCRISGTS
jgi:hypothetical protein